MNNPLTMFGEKRCEISEKDLPKLKTVLDDIDIIVCSEENLDLQDYEFIQTLKKNTTTPEVRMRRCLYIVDKLNRFLG